jgi:dihydroorotase
MSTRIIKNATLVNEGRTFKGDVLIKDDIISAVGDLSSINIPENAKVIDAKGLMLIPGVIDDQVHFREPGLTHKGDIFTESRAAVAGGITSYMEMPNTVPQTISNSLLSQKSDLASQKSFANYSFYLGATNTNLDEILNANPSEVCGVKLFMGSSTGNMLVDNENSLRALFAGAGIPVVCHCESEPLIKRNSEFYRNRYGEDIPIQMHPMIRSREACFASSSYAISLAREYNTQLHILHLSTADEMKLFNNDQPLGRKRITGEVCIHHLWFDDSSYDEKGNLIKWNPAIKTRFDREALIKAIASDVVDIVATDHAPHTIEEKKNTYFRAPSGGPLVQHSLVVMLEFWHNKVLTIEKIVEKMCHNPAILFKIKGRGYIREGYKADLCLFDPHNSWTVSKENILYKCGWSPFEGTTFRSKVVMTIVNGNLIYDNGIINDNYRGERLLFDR